MAIKGKKKKSGSGKTRTTAPRRPIVERRPAFLARRSVLATALAVAFLAAGFGIGWGLKDGGTSTTEAPTQVTTEGTQHIAEFRSKVDPILSPLGSTSVPTASGSAPSFSLFPGFSSAVEQLKSGTLSAAKFGIPAQGAAQQAKAAAQSLAGIKVSDYTKGVPTRIADEMYIARGNMSQAMDLLGKTIGLFTVAASMPAADRKVVVARTSQVLQSADQTFQLGYAAYAEVLGAARLTSATVPKASPSLPSQQAPKSRVPSPSSPPATSASRP